MTDSRNPQYDKRSLAMIDAVKHRIMILDGAMGTMIQKRDLPESSFRGTQFQSWDCPLKGCNDLLCLTAPDVISSIHTEYLNAGATIIETNSFNANAISLADYGLSGYVTGINLAAARLARTAADTYHKTHPESGCYVAGSVGPTSKSLTMSSGAEDDGITWDYLVSTYTEQMSALIDGGVDALLIETIFDGLNAKAAIYAARRAMENTGRRVPLMLSVTLTESGRTLSGQTIEAFVATVAHAEPLSIGLNCGFGADGMMKHIEALQKFPFAVSVYPNAGLPNEMGEYDETPGIMARKLQTMTERGLINIVGGCCGTTPGHIHAIASMARQYAPRPIPMASELLTLAGLEPLEVSPRCNFMNIGERCNVAGSRKFLRLIKEKSNDEAIGIACTQVEAGAQVVDINMDDAMLDSKTEMSAFIDRINTDPEVARVPLMIDSSDWETIVAGLKHTQGRPIVNSISLKEGEALFTQKARFIREMGAAVVVMAFDEQGQADTFERKIEVCSRAYRILTGQIGFRGHEIIFDPNVLAIATGIKAHNSYALDFIRATSWIKANLPGAKVSGGISNLSFSFRGNNYVREAMHAVFLYHAIAAGMDMGIVNAGAMIPVDEIPQQLRNALEDVILNRSDDATEKLTAIAEQIKGNNAPTQENRQDATAPVSATEAVECMLIKGTADGLEHRLEQLMKETGSATAIIDSTLMVGMNRVGQLFGEGKMFLPQVVKSARTMKQAVTWLTPYIEQEKLARGNSTSGKVVIATVKGDVHDIGKNIVNVIMNCNGFEMIDLGVMVPAEDIVAKAKSENADFIGLSGLITPSLDEMCTVARLMEAEGMTIPLLIGGATTSELHTAVKIAPCYSGPVVYIRDAAMIPTVAHRLMNPETRESAVIENREQQQQLRDRHNSHRQLLTIVEARSRRFEYGDNTVIPTPKHPGIHDLTISAPEARQRINWRAFFAVWKLDPSFASIVQKRDKPTDGNSAKQDEAMRLWEDANHALDSIEKALADDGLHARVALLPAGSHNEEIIYRNGETDYTLPTPRQLTPEPSNRLALADFIRPIVNTGKLEDWIGIFAVTAGLKLQEIIDRYKSDADDYNAILYQSLADRLAEAATEIMHDKVRDELWGHTGKGIRPAIGYPSLPDQRLVFLADKVLDYNALGITLTENGALFPQASTTGYIFAHPQARYFSVI